MFGRDAYVLLNLIVFMQIALICLTNGALCGWDDKKDDSPSKLLTEKQKKWVRDCKNKRKQGTRLSKFYLIPKVTSRCSKLFSKV